MQCEKLAPGYWFEGLGGGDKQWSLKYRHSLSKFVSSPLKSLNLEDPLTKHYH